MLKQKRYIFVALFWTLIITYLSLATLDTSFSNNIQIQYKDKMVHFVFYFLFVVFWTFGTRKFAVVPKIPLVITFLAIFYGVIMELCQAFFTTTRSADIFDVISNSAGAICGFLFCKLYFSKKK